MSTELREVQIPGKTFLGVSVRMLLEKISILTNRLSEEDPYSPMWVDIIQSIKDLDRTTTTKT